MVKTFFNQGCHKILSREASSEGKNTPAAIFAGSRLSLKEFRERRGNFLYKIRDQSPKIILKKGHEKK